MNLTDGNRDMALKSQSSLWDKEYTKSMTWNRQTMTIQDKILKGKNVLELGVGNGKTLISVMQQKPKSISAIDFSKEAINLCKSNPKFNKISFYVADIASMPFKNVSFDAVVCYYVLDALDQKGRAKAISEMKRVLRSNGTILFEDFALGDFRQEQSKKVIDSSTIQKPSGIMCHFFDIPELSVLFNDFKIKNLSAKAFKPFKTNSNIQRKIISGMFIK
jgi:ubiquinone/menaquinone biosynthesis C-methylase UbiE